MSTQVLIQKLNKELAVLKEDFKEVKKFLFAPLKDDEGEYRDSYVKKILSRSQRQGRFYRFVNAKDFLKHVRKRKWNAIMEFFLVI